MTAERPGLPDPTNVDAVRAWLANRAPDLPAVEAWAARLLTDLAAHGAVPTLGSPVWCALPDRDPRKLAAAVRPAVAHLLERTCGALGAQLRAELDQFATTWQRTAKDVSADVSRAWTDLGYTVGPSHAELVRRRQLTTTTPCAACYTPVTLLHPLPDQHAARLPDMSWVRCPDCTREAPKNEPASSRRRAAA